MRLYALRELLKGFSWVLFSFGEVLAVAEVYRPEKWSKTEYKNRFGELIASYCEEVRASFGYDVYGIAELKKDTQQTYYSALSYIYSHTFEADNYILKDHENYYKISSKQLYSSNYNAYNYNVLSDILDVFIFYCDLLNKIPDQKGFILITGLNYQTLNRWIHKYKNQSINNINNNHSVLDSSVNSLNILCSDIVLKLLLDKKSSLEARAYDGKTNPTGAAIVLNNEFYNVQTVQDDSSSQQRLEGGELAGLLADIKSE